MLLVYCVPLLRFQAPLCSPISLCKLSERQSGYHISCFLGLVSHLSCFLYLFCHLSCLSCLSLSCFPYLVCKSSQMRGLVALMYSRRVWVYIWHTAATSERGSAPSPPSQVQGVSHSATRLCQRSTVTHPQEYEMLPYMYCHSALKLWMEYFFNVPSCMFYCFVVYEVWAALILFFPHYSGLFCFQELLMLLLIVWVTTIGAY